MATVERVDRVERADPMRSHLVARLGEFVGTFLFLFFAFAGTQVANDITDSDTANVGQLLYIACAFGFSLAVNVWMFYRVSGGMFNPAVSFGLALVGAIGWLRLIVVWIAQFLGAIASAAVVSALLPGALNVATNISADTSPARGLFIEMFITAELILVIMFLAVAKHRATYLAPLGIGLALFIIELASVRYTGGSANPARSFAPHVVSGDWPGNHWIYWLGPFLGAVLAWAVFKLMQWLDYEVNGAVGQDYDHADVVDGVSDVKRVATLPPPVTATTVANGPALRAMV